MHTISPAVAAIKPPVHIDITSRLHALLRRAIAHGLDVATRSLVQSFLAWDRSCVFRSLVSDKLRLMSAELARVSTLELLIAGWALLLMAVELRSDNEQLERLVELAEVDFCRAMV